MEYTHFMEQDFLRTVPFFVRQTAGYVSIYDTSPAVESRIAARPDIDAVSATLEYQLARSGSSLLVTAGRKLQEEGTAREGLERLFVQRREGGECW